MSSSSFQLRQSQGSAIYDFQGGSGEAIRYVVGTFQDNMSDGIENATFTFDTIAKGNSPDAIKIAFKIVEQHLNMSYLWINNPTETERVYFFIRGKDVSSAGAFATVLAWSRVDHNSSPHDNLLDDTPTVLSTWTITRPPFWSPEESDLRTMGTGCNGGASYTGSGVPTGGFAKGTIANLFDIGTAPGRIKRFFLSTDSFSNSDKLAKFWFGYKRITTNPAANFPPLVNVETTNGEVTIAPGGTSDVNTNFTDSDALNSRCTEIEWSTQGISWKEKIYFPFPNKGVATIADLAGTYLMLYRMKSAASTEFRTNMLNVTKTTDTNWGVNLTDTHQDVYVNTEGEYEWFNMGIVQYPSVNVRDAYPGNYGSHDIHDYQQLGLGAERITGSGNLYVDYVVWIPAEHYIYAENINTWGNSGWTTPKSNLEIFNDEENNVYGFATSWDDSNEAATRHIEHLQVEAHNWVWEWENTGGYIAIGVFMDNPFGDGSNVITQAFTPAFDVIGNYHSIFGV